MLRYCGKGQVLGDLAVQRHGSNGTLYAVPKDKDTVGLVYNKEMFDAAGVAYPDENWTWDDLVSASEKIYAATGKYGYMAYADDQLGYWNFVYQAGGYILNEDKTKAGFTQPATEKAMKFYIGLQQNDWCPDQTYFAETAPGTAFFSEKGAMFLEGDWNILAELQNYPEMVGKWDVAVLQVPRPGKRRRSCDHLQRSVLRYCCQQQESGYREGYPEVLRQRGGAAHSGESGAAIPAYQGLEDTWAGCFAEYPINIQCFIEMFEYSIQSVNNASRPEWKSKVNDELLKIYAGTEDIDTGLQKMQDIVDQASAG